MMEVFARVERVASSACTVLVTGETGNRQGAGGPGDPSQRRDPHRTDWSRSTARRFRNTCWKASSSATSGVRSPAPTGSARAASSRPAGVRCCSTRSASFPFGMQAKLLRVLQEARFERVGGTEPIATDCRVIAATNRNLAEAVAAHRFREDLYYRLNVVSIDLPPLRERLDDVPLLVNHFLEKLVERGLASQAGRPRDPVSTLRYDWPGNVRELEHVIEQTVVTTPGPVIEPDNLPPQIVPLREEPFSLDFDHCPPPAGAHRRVYPADRARLPDSRPREIPRPDRSLRRALRPIPSQHQREASPLPD